MPLTAMDTSVPAELWDWMDRQRENGSALLAVPHNGNASDGMMFPVGKGWIEDGDQRERIYDVALSGDRTDASETVGNTVDVATASYTNDIGAAELSVAWTDPDFDPDLPALYYARVLQIPTPRWSTYDARTLGVEVPEGLPTSIRERAWSSPIRYTP